MEAAGLERPAYIVNTSHPGADVTAQAAAALAASSKVGKENNSMLNN